MPFDLNHDPAEGIVEIALSRPITGEEIRRATTAAVSRRAAKFLIDLNGWDVSASFVDLYNLAEKQYTDEEVDRRSRIAVLLPTSASGREAVRFYETVCRNRGWNVRVCRDRQSAVEWLAGADDSNEPNAAIG